MVLTPHLALYEAKVLLVHRKNVSELVHRAQGRHDLCLSMKIPFNSIISPATLHTLYTELIAHALRFAVSYNALQHCCLFYFYLS